MCPFAFTATPVASPRYMSLGIFRGSDPSKGITGTSCANKDDVSSANKPTSKAFMIPPFAWVRESIAISRLRSESLSGLDDFVELLALDVGVDLHPQRQVVRQLMRERVLSQTGKQVLRASGEEIDD